MTLAIVDRAKNIKSVASLKKSIKNFMLRSFPEELKKRLRQKLKKSPPFFSRAHILLQLQNPRLHPSLKILLCEGIAKLLRAQIRAFFVGFGFFAKCLWPIGYVTLQKTEPTKKSSNLAHAASFAIPSCEKAVHFRAVMALKEKLLRVKL